VHRAADYLLGRGAPERAIPLYLKLRDAACAARALAEEADRLVDLGQWDTLGDWLAGLPADVLKVEPRLLYDQAEVAAASGHGDAAQRGFSAAASRFTALYDPDGVCRSMLAESALAAGRGDYARATARAHAASVVADAAGIAWHQLWASWQLGWVAVGAQQLDSAPAHFGRAAAIASQVGERHLVDVVLEAERLTDRLQQLRRRQMSFGRQGSPSSVPSRRRPLGSWSIWAARPTMSTAFSARMAGPIHRWRSRCRCCRRPRRWRRRPTPNVGGAGYAGRSHPGARRPPTGPLIPQASLRPALPWCGRAITRRWVPPSRCSPPTCSANSV
jgi:hypothetical protein